MVQERLRWTEGLPAMADLAGDKLGAADSGVVLM